MEKLFQQLGEHLGYVLVAIITVLIVAIKDLIKKWLEKKQNKKDAINTSKVKINCEVNELLAEFRVLSDSARISILQFHNGDYFYNGSPILKFSMTHESCARGVSRIIEKIQAYHLSAYYQLLELSELDFKIHSTKELKESNIKGYMDVNNTVSFSVFSIKCQKNFNIIGLILIEWCSESKSKMINTEETGKICDKYVGLVKNIINNQK
jgi:hypothetical protein